MRRVIFGAALVAALAAPATVAAKPTKDEKRNAARECRAERDAMGSDNFKAEYGSNKNGKNAFGKCVSRTAREEERESEKAKENAARLCKTEQDADPQAFEEKYGSNGNGKNAFGKCVSQQRRAQKEAADEQDEQELEAARECRAEQKDDEDAFRDKYGTNRNGKNAFGKCVSQKVEESESA